MNTLLTHIKPVRLWQALFATCVILIGSLPSASGHESEEDVRPVRAEKLANAPGQTLTAVTVNYAPGGKSSAHRHSGSVFAYVLSGAIRSENSATGPAKIYHAGESFFEPAGTQHLVSENASTTEPASMLVVFVAEDGAQLTTRDTTGSDLAHQIFNTMLRVHGAKPGNRPVHAKGIVCEGMFSPSSEAQTLSRANHLQADPVPVTIRFSDGATDPTIPDNSPDAGPRGMAIRFKLRDGDVTDIVAMSHNGFVVGTGEEFLALQQAIVATDPSKPHPWPIEEFLGAHPRALKFVQENQVIPASFATEEFFSNDALIFVNKQGTKQALRYRIIPTAGRHVLTDAEAKGRQPDFLMEELKQRLATGPITFRLVAQLPNSGDVTSDPSVVWPEDRRTVELGIISITSTVADNASAGRELAFDPMNLTEGIEPSDDPLPALRSKVYALSAKHRQ